MKVSGFTFIRNAQKFDYPVVEAILSILPLCDELVVCVGLSEDNTRDMIQALPSDKIKIIDSVWDDSLREGGQVLAVETNKAFDAIAPDTDWAFYIQGDEVLHEQYIPIVRSTMERYKDNFNVEGLLFQYTHFYGNYCYVGDSRKWYRHEIRIIRNNKSIRSFKDAQGFRLNNRKLYVKPVDAHIYHYGWVKPPKQQQAKAETFHRLWHSDEWVENNISKVDEFDYTDIDSLQPFTGSHPAIMQERIARVDWHFSFNAEQRRLSFRQKLLLLLEKLTGIRWFEYKNYKKIK